MFGTDGRSTDQGGQGGRPGHQERRVAAWIGASILIRGDLTSSENMTVAGRVEGDVTLREHALVVAPGARIDGNVVARAVTIHGQVNGTVTAEQTVEVGEKGSVDGDIVAPRMIVTEGAVLHGKVRVAAGSAAAPTERAPSHAGG